MNDGGELKAFFWLFCILMLVGMVIFAAVAAVFVAMLLSGLIAVRIAHSAKDKVLVKDIPLFHAIGMSLAWSAALCVGGIFGSVALAAGIALAQSSFLDQFALHYGEAHNLRGALLVLDNWVVSSAIPFFCKTAVVIYLANRAWVQIQRKEAGTSWLGTLPPLAALAIFFVADHWELVMRALTSLSDLDKLGQLLLAVALEPIELAVHAFQDPDVVIKQGIDKLVETDGNMFKLAEVVFSHLFFFMTVAVGVRALTDAVTSS